MKLNRVTIISSSQNSSFSSVLNILPLEMELQHFNILSVFFMKLNLQVGDGGNKILRVSWDLYIVTISFLSQVYYIHSKHFSVLKAGRSAVERACSIFQCLWVPGVEMASALWVTLTQTHSTATWIPSIRHYKSGYTILF